ncbi:MAG: extracellular solute-binding protein [bacterium]|nr:extracellular solute-binding protein [bacterium]MCM1373800.1 extracellular solute-binding protein [Muribaculum sp.]
MKLSPYFFSLVLIGILTGCSGSEAGNTEQTKTAAESQAVRPDLDWRTDAWKFDTLSASTHDLYITGYVPDFEYDDAEGYTISDISFCCLADKFYRFDRLEREYAPAADGARYYLNCYDSGTEEAWQEKVTLPKLKEYEEYDVLPMKLDMISDKEYALFFAVYGPEKEVMAYPVVQMSLDGKQLSATDLYPAMRESGLEIKPSYGYRDVYADRQGYYYLLADEHCLSGLEPGKIMVLDAEGNAVGTMGSEETNIAAEFAMKDPDGNAVFEIYESGAGEIRLTGYSSASGEKLYAEVSLEARTPKAMSEDGYLYYGTGAGKLYRWDLYTGTREFCVDYQALGLDSISSELSMTIDGKGQPLLAEHGQGSTRIYQLGTESENAQSTIRMVCLAEDCPYVSRCAVDYSRDNPNCIIRLDKPDVEGLSFAETDQAVQDYRTRALAELVAGKGADLYYVTAEDMEMLYEKGVLADLSDVLPQDYLDAIFPGALGCGVIDGKQIGLVPEAYVTAVMVDSALWSEESWSWDEAMAVKEANPERNQLLTLRYTRSRVVGFGNVAIQELYLRYLSETPFLDVENGTCDFDSARFIQLLEMLKGMGPGTYGNDAVQEQKTVAFMEDVWDFPMYAVMMSEYDGQYHLVGFPTKNGYGNYWSCDYYVVVNKDTVYWDQIKEYLISLFDYSRQLGNDGAVRNDLIEGNLRIDEYNPSHPLMWGMHYIPEKPDGLPGSTWDQEYMDLLNSAVPYRNSTSDVENIILEELDSFFSGDKDAQTVAAMIQNRVQLYLNERK